MWHPGLTSIKLVTVCCLLTFVVIIVKPSLVGWKNVPKFSLESKACHCADNNLQWKQVRCMLRSEYMLHRWQPRTRFTWKFMSTVQIEPSQPSGFASRCDWVVGSRPGHWRQIPDNSFWGDVEKMPRTIFVQVEQAQRFNDNILPCLDSSARIALITGDHDATLPQQVDKRYAPYLHRDAWNSWLRDDRIMHMFIEHLDEETQNPKVTPIPLGLNPLEFPGNNVDYHDPQNISAPAFDLLERPLRAWRTDRCRSGDGQWQERALVRSLCVTAWARFCESALKEIPMDQFFKTTSTYPFLLCVHGGGLDPNPKAWEALMAGTIPIIRRFPGDEIYCGLPVVRVLEWNNNTLDGERMESWRRQLAPHFLEKDKRKIVVEQLMAEHWWSKVERSLDHPGLRIALCDPQIALDAY
jgi:hypothetical protein